MVRRLAAFFTLIAFVIFSTTWLIRRMVGFPTADVTAMFGQGVVVLMAYFIIGMFIAKMGVALINEILDTKHVEEEDKRERARNLYLSAISGGKPASLAGGFTNPQKKKAEDPMAELSEPLDEISVEDTTE